MFCRQIQVKIDQCGKFVIARKGLKQVIRPCGGEVALAEVQIADYNGHLGTDWMFQWRDPISQNGQNDVNQVLGRARRSQDTAHIPVRVNQTNGDH